jgi:NADPH:quinone reductase-like Zn-dependent oxidoreductase
VVELGNKEGPYLEAKLTKPGFPGSIRFKEVEEELPQHCDLDDSEILIHVHAVGVSYSDYLIASGQAQDDETGVFSECAGEVLQTGSSSGFKAGDRVLVRYPLCCRTFVRLPGAFAAPLPPNFTFTEGAAFPTAGLLALYALQDLGHISPGDTILVRHGAQSIGQLAIQFAQLFGAKVIVTEDSSEKQKMLQALYNLPVDLVVSDDEPAILNVIHRVTPGGVDLVLNMDSQDLGVSLTALAPFGTLVNLGLSRDVPPDHLLRDAAYKCITLAPIDLAQLHRQKPATIQKLLGQLSRFMLNGSLIPVAHLKVFGASDVSKAIQSVDVNSKGSYHKNAVLDLGPGQSVSVSKHLVLRFT